MDIGVERYSSPFFFEPFYTAKIPSSILNVENQETGPLNANEDDHFIYGEWVTEKMREFGEFKDLFKKKKSVIETK